MSNVLTSAVPAVTVTPAMDFNTVLGLFTAGRISPEQFTEYQAARETTVAAFALGTTKPVAGAQRPKTVPTLTRAYFDGAAKPLDVMINGVPAAPEPKQFSTGSFGWGHSGKVTLKVGDKLVACQVSLNITVIGSKDLA